MPIYRPKLKNTKLAVKSTCKLHAAIDPTGAVKVIEPPIKSLILGVKQQAAIDPTGAIKKVDLL